MSYTESTLVRSTPPRLTRSCPRMGHWPAGRALARRSTLRFKRPWESGVEFLLSSTDSTQVRREALHPHIRDAMVVSPPWKARDASADDAIASSSTAGHRALFLSSGGRESVRMTGISRVHSGPVPSTHYGVTRVLVPVNLGAGAWPHQVRGQARSRSRLSILQLDSPRQTSAKSRLQLPSCPWPRSSKCYEGFSYGVLVLSFLTQLE